MSAEILKPLTVAFLLAGWVHFGCSRFASDDPGLVVEQRAINVPDEAEVQHMLQIFADETSAYSAPPEMCCFDVNAPLVVEWHAAGEVFDVHEGDDGREYLTVAQTDPDGSRIRVSSPALVFHELSHVHFIRTFGDGDHNHELEPGPWTAETNALIRRAQARYLDLISVSQRTDQ